MDINKFKKRRRDDSGEPSQQYDFSSVANDAVSNMRVGKSTGDPWSADEPYDFGSTDDLYDTAAPTPGQKRGFSLRGLGKKKSAETSDLWDQPVSREDVLGENSSRRKPFAFGKSKAPTQDDSERGQSEEQSTEGSDRSRRKPFAFGKGKPQASASEPAAHETKSTDSSEHGYNAAYSDSFDDFDSEIPTPTFTPRQPAAQEQPQRRVFNAATQPNYEYMSAPPAAPEPVSEQSAGFFSSLKGKILTRLGRDEPGVEYYTPPAGHAPSTTRRRQKRRNRKPWPQWLKLAVFGVCLAASFFLILYISFFAIITSRINYVGDITKQGDIRLSVAEYANLKADLTNTEENAAEFTEPLSVAEPSEDVKVIMVISSDSQIGDNNGKTAKTDSIMLIALDHENRRIRIASIMTDTYVRIQDYKTNKLSKAYYYDTANGDFSLTCLKNAVRDNFGVIPDNYIVVDFEAFQILVNRLGGVDIEVSADEAYYMSAHERYGDYPRFNSAGKYTMSGAEALNYVRMRAVGNDDYDRVARQRKVFMQILSELQDKSLLELAELAYALLPELPTDITSADMFSYLLDASDIASYEVTEVTFPITNSWRYGTASVRDEEDDANEMTVPSVTSESDLVSGSDFAPTDDKKDPSSTKFTVIVTNFQFNATALQNYLYNNDEAYLNGTAANGISIPEIIAPLEDDSPAAGLDPAA